VAKLFESLLLPEGERDEAAREFYLTLSRKAQKTVDRLAGTRSKVPAATFLDALPLCAARGGLLACDDIGAAIRVLGKLQGEELTYLDPVDPNRESPNGILLGQVQGGAELVRFYLSDAYHQVQSAVWT
jgi:hypothetical protein